MFDIKINIIMISIHIEVKVNTKCVKSVNKLFIRSNSSKQSMFGLYLQVRTQFRIFFFTKVLVIFRLSFMRLSRQHNMCGKVPRGKHIEYGRIVFTYESNSYLDCSLHQGDTAPSFLELTYLF